jgi:hypothetical protein
VVGFGWSFGAKLCLDEDANSLVYVALLELFSSLEHGERHMLEFRRRRLVSPKHEGGGKGAKVNAEVSKCACEKIKCEQ